MSVKMELNLPRDFFESANSENQNESVSERIAKAFLKDILNIDGIKRGDANINEPDYVSNGEGYEVTFATSESLIPQLKGKKDLNKQQRNIEQELTDSILNAVNRKNEKSYSCATSLVIITIDMLPTWYYPFFANIKDRFEEFIWRRYAAFNRNKFFSELNSTYIQSGKFKNIYIIQPMHDGNLAFYNLRDFGENKENFITCVRPSVPELFPTYRVVESVREVGKPITYEITVVNYV